eukprot:GHVT01090878.1.p1 GENE.GHVT01090878.1~~GHVT01090878.1.p1  ORF type:complete len:525 (+),score=139.30 GHVT01090878.1:950-2524(+)
MEGVRSRRRHVAIAGRPRARAQVSGQDESLANAVSLACCCPPWRFRSYKFEVRGVSSISAAFSPVCVRLGFCCAATAFSGITELNRARVSSSGDGAAQQKGGSGPSANRRRSRARPSSSSRRSSGSGTDFAAAKPPAVAASSSSSSSSSSSESSFPISRAASLVRRARKAAVKAELVAPPRAEAETGKPSPPSKAPANEAPVRSRSTCTDSEASLAPGPSQTLPAAASSPAAVVQPREMPVEPAIQPRACVPFEHPAVPTHTFEQAEVPDSAALTNFRGEHLVHSNPPEAQNEGGDIPDECLPREEVLRDRLQIKLIRPCRNYLELVYDVDSSRRFSIDFEDARYLCPQKIICFLRGRIVVRGGMRRNHAKIRRTPGIRPPAPEIPPVQNDDANSSASSSSSSSTLSLLFAASAPTLSSAASGPAVSAPVFSTNAMPSLSAQAVPPHNLSAPPNFKDASGRATQGGTPKSLALVDAANETNGTTQLMKPLGASTQTLKRKRSTTTPATSGLMTTAAALSNVPAM